MMCRFLACFTIAFMGLTACGESTRDHEPTLFADGPRTAKLTADAGFASSVAAAGWTVTTYDRGILGQVPPLSFGDLNLGSSVATPAGPSVLTGTPGSITPDGLSSASNLRVPLYSSAVAQLNNGTGTQKAQVLNRTVTVSETDFDPVDNKVHLRLGFAPVIADDLTTDPNVAPFIFLEISNQSRGGAILLTRFVNRAQTEPSWQTDPSTQTSYLPWQTVDLVPGPDQIDIGDQIQINIVAANALSSGGGTAAIYVDAFTHSLPLTTAVLYGPTQLGTPGGANFGVRVTRASPDAGGQANVLIALPANWNIDSFREPDDVNCTTLSPSANQVILSCLFANIGAESTRVVGFHASSTETTEGPSVMTTLVQADNGLSVMGPPLTVIRRQTLALADLSAALVELNVDACRHIATYSATYTNLGPAAAQATQVGMLLPSSLTPIDWECVASTAAQCAGGSSATGTGRLNLGAALAASGQISCTVRLQIAPTATGDLFPAVFTKALNATPDPLTYNNTGASRLSLSLVPPCQASNVTPTPRSSGPLNDPALAPDAATSCFNDADCAAGTYCNPLYFCEQPNDTPPSPWFLEGAGGPAAGCQAAGAGTSFFAVVAWGACVLRRISRRRTQKQVVLGLALILVSGQAHAQAAPEALSFPTNHFRLYAGANDIYSVQAARTREQSGALVMVFGNYADRLLRVVAGDRTTEQFILKSQTTLDAGLSISSDRGYELGFVLPITWQQTNRAAYFSTSLIDSPETFGIGDLRVVPKVTLLRQPAWAVGLSVPVSLPTGKPRAFLGFNQATATPTLLASAGAPARLQALFSAGFSFRPRRGVGTVDIKDAFVWGAAGVIPFSLQQINLAGKVSVTGEVGVGSERKNAMPVEAHAGLKINLHPLWALDVGAGTGLNNSAGMPRWRVFSGLTFQSPATIGRESKNQVIEAPAPVAVASLLPNPVDAPAPPPLPAEVSPDTNIFAEAVLFDLERSQLRVDAEPVLENMVAWINHLDANASIVIEGHADNHGGQGLNHRLTVARAASLKKWFISHGVLETRLIARGCGTQYPVADNLSEEGRAKNRRGVIHAVLNAPAASEK